MQSTNIVKQDYKISKKDRIKLLGQKPVIIWLTGLSGSGKSTIADRLEQVDCLFPEQARTQLPAARLGRP